MAAALALTRLRLEDFRSWPELTVSFGPRLVLICGENGAGKTNLLEAISLLGPGRGLRGARLLELGRLTPAGPSPWAAAGLFASPAGPFDLGTGTPAAAPGDGARRRAFQLDGEPVRGGAALAERVAIVWLTPQMDRLLVGEAGGRRHFLDRLVWALEPHHAAQVAAYERAMAGRRRLLAGDRRGRRPGQPDAAWLAALEDAMARHGTALAAARRSLVARLNGALAAGVTGAFPAARLELACPVAGSLDTAPALAVEDAMRAGWETGRALDAASGTTRQGPHRADLRVHHLARDLPAALCSTGEQKALLISLVLAHAALMAAARGFAPILLLDEVAAHLDAPRREALFAALHGLAGQSFLTGTDAGAFSPMHGLAEGWLASPGRLTAHPAFPRP